MMPMRLGDGDMGINHMDLVMASSPDQSLDAILGVAPAREPAA
jgi:hypothetical protein